MESIVHNPLAPGALPGTVVFARAMSACGYASQQVHLGGEFTAFQFGFKGRSTKAAAGNASGNVPGGFPELVGNGNLATTVWHLHQTLMHPSERDVVFSTQALHGAGRCSAGRLRR